ncbi:MAG: flagellar hook-length control protein FliK [Planctomycetaceae bacterium]
MVIIPALPVGADFLKTAPIEPRRIEPTAPVDETPVARRSDDVRKSDEEAPVEKEKPEEDSDDDDFSDMLNQAMMASGQVQQPKAETPKDNAGKEANSVATINTKSTSADSASQALATNTQSSEQSNQKQNAGVALSAATPVITESSASEQTESSDASVEELLRPLLNSQQTQTSEDDPANSLKAEVVAELPETESVSGQPATSVADTLGELRLSAIQTSGALEANQTAEAATPAAPVLKVTKPSDALMTIQADPDDVTEEIISALQRTAESATSTTSSTIGAASQGGVAGTVGTSGQRSAGAILEPTLDNAAVPLPAQAGNDVQAVTNLTSTMTQGGDLPGRRSPASESGNSALQSGSVESASPSASAGVSGASASSAGVVTSGAAPDFASTLTAEVRQPLSSQVSRAVLEHLERGSNSENDRLTVRLDPPELGEMTIELSKTKEGLAVRVTAREAVTMDMLLARGSEIEQQLKSQDLNLKALEFLSPGMMGQSDSSSSQRRESSDTRESGMGLRSTGSRRGVNGSAGSRSVSATNGPQESSKALSFRA